MMKKAQDYSCSKANDPSKVGVTGGLIPQYSWSRLGNAIIILGEHRFKKRSSRVNQKQEVHWVCNKCDKGCKAKLTTLNDAIVKMYNVHDHDKV
ncbi:Modifier of mdg4 [Operophtera brumata]|uniref:Modifier of mdg4 n=1 Tax=Operophtera brumata TaxID=104452 RepID=A0A0L7LEZ0_OPEBR|nr:Modifier of mdg4 [Operophtera brumata]